MNSAQVANRSRGAWPTRLLLYRSFVTLAGDKVNIALFIVQPLVISGLISLVAAHDHAIPEKLFLGCVASLWLGCSNAAQIIVKERPIFIRERLAGLRLHAYLWSKFIGMAMITCVQVFMIYAVLYFTGAGLVGNVSLQLLAMVGGALCLTGIGVFLSAVSHSVTQAILAVPMIIIPQILFCGYVFNLESWIDKPATTLISRLSPSYSAQKLIDVSLLWGKELDYDYLDKYEISSPHKANLEVALIPTKYWLFHQGEKLTITAEEQAKYYQSTNPDRPLRDIEVEIGRDYPDFRLGYVYQHWEAIRFPLISFAVWLVLAYLGAWVALARAS